MEVKANTYPQEIDYSTIIPPTPHLRSQKKTTLVGRLNNQKPNTKTPLNLKLLMENSKQFGRLKTQLHIQRVKIFIMCMSVYF